MALRADRAGHWAVCPRHVDVQFIKNLRSGGGCLSIFLHWRVLLDIFILQRQYAASLQNHPDRNALGAGAGHASDDFASACFYDCNDLALYFEANQTFDFKVASSRPYTPMPAAWIYWGRVDVVQLGEI